MKILDIPQCGNLGVFVGQGRRFGQIRRTLAIPTNPKTSAQRLVRAHLTAVAQSWRVPTEDQRAAWTAAAKSVNSKTRLGTNGALTGNNLFANISATLLETGSAVVRVPPAQASFEANPVSAFAIANAAGVIPLKLAVGALNDGQSLRTRVSAPISQGQEVSSNFRELGACPPATGGVADFTTLYATKFRAPGLGKKVYVQACQTTNG